MPLLLYTIATHLVRRWVGTPLAGIIFSDMVEDTTKTNSQVQTGEFAKLLEEYFSSIPSVGDTVKGKVLSVSKGEVRVDVEGLAAGVIRGRELFNESTEYANIASGDEVEATVVEVENENGEMELSFRVAGHARAWENIIGLNTSGEVVDIKVLDANKGGLMVQYDALRGFLPVSQLSPDHYPRVPGGDKQKILERLKEYAGQTFRAKVLDVNQKEEKIIFSEKAVWEDEQKSIISAYNVGDLVEGSISALTSFGAFVKFGELEGLVHISELAWQRIDHPRDVVKTGQEVKAKIIQIDGSKIFLSMKQLMEDPWVEVAKKYAVGDKVQGKVLKVNPFGLFVELDNDIHGLAHVSELSDTPIEIKEFAQPGDTLEFEIVNIEPAEHRLGLRIPGVTGRSAQEEAQPEAPKEEEAPAPETQEPAPVAAQEEVPAVSEAEAPVETPAEVSTE